MRAAVVAISALLLTSSSRGASINQASVFGPLASVSEKHTNVARQVANHLGASRQDSGAQGIQLEQDEPVTDIFTCLASTPCGVGAVTLIGALAEPGDSTASVINDACAACPNRDTAFDSAIADCNLDDTDGTLAAQLNNIVGVYTASCGEPQCAAEIPALTAAFESFDNLTAAERARLCATYKGCGDDILPPLLRLGDIPTPQVGCMTDAIDLLICSSGSNDQNCFDLGESDNTTALCASGCARVLDDGFASLSRAECSSLGLEHPLTNAIPCTRDFGYPEGVKFDNFCARNENNELCLDVLDSVTDLNLTDCGSLAIGETTECSDTCARDTSELANTGCCANWFMDLQCIPNEVRTTVAGACGEELFDGKCPAAPPSGEGGGAAHGRAAASIVVALSVAAIALIL